MSRTDKTRPTWVRENDHLEDRVWWPYLHWDSRAREYVTGAWTIPFWIGPKCSCCRDDKKPGKFEPGSRKGRSMARQRLREIDPYREDPEDYTAQDEDEWFW